MPIAITDQPHSQTVLVGEMAVFAAAATGDPTPAVQWWMSEDGGLNFIPIPGATRTDYTFVAQPTDDGKQFRAVFTNGVSENVTTDVAVLTVYWAPIITQLPQSQSVSVGQKVMFSAAVTANPEPSVQWQDSADNGSTWIDIPGATLATYEFTAQAADNGKQYHAFFANSVGGVVTGAATLTVNGPAAPTVTTNPSSRTVLAGQTATFDASASGNPSPTVQWQISPDGRNWSDIAGATSTPYSFTAQPTDNAKLYRAIFANSLGTATTNTATLSVYYVTVTTQPASQTVKAGRTASFSAAATGNPVSITAQWQVSADSGATWTNIVGATSTKLSFTAQAGDNGKQYRAVFTNSATSTTTDAATLRINYAPTVTLQPTSLTVSAGQSATLTAAASGNPSPTVQWQVSTSGGKRWSNVTSGVTTEPTASGVTSTLTLSGVTTNMNGYRYRAVFTNSAGSATTSAAVLTVG